jgi:hypothetical protein
MSPRTIGPELIVALKRLRLGGLLPTLPERFSLAEKEDTPYEDLILMLLTDEISRRDSTASTRRAEVAGLDSDMVLERWDKTAKVTYDRRVMNELVSLRFVEDHRNVVVLGSARPFSRTRLATSAAARDSTCGCCAPTPCCGCSSRAAWTTRARR